jgi:hypothetical protein
MTNKTESRKCVYCIIATCFGFCGKPKHVEIKYCKQTCDWRFLFLIVDYRSWEDITHNNKLSLRCSVKPKFHVAVWARWRRCREKERMNEEWLEIWNEVVKWVREGNNWGHKWRSKWLSKEVDEIMNAARTVERKHWKKQRIKLRVK